MQINTNRIAIQSFNRYFFYLDILLVPLLDRSVLVKHTICWKAYFRALRYDKYGRGEVGEGNNHELASNDYFEDSSPHPMPSGKFMHIISALWI